MEADAEVVAERNAVRRAQSRVRSRAIGCLDIVRKILQPSDPNSSFDPILSPNPSDGNSLRKLACESINLAVRLSRPEFHPPEAPKDFFAFSFALHSAFLFQYRYSAMLIVLELCFCDSLLCDRKDWLTFQISFKSPLSPL